MSGKSGSRSKKNSQHKRALKATIKTSSNVQKSKTTHPSSKKNTSTNKLTSKAVSVTALALSTHNKISRHDNNNIQLISDEENRKITRQLKSQLFKELKMNVRPLTKKVIKCSNNLILQKSICNTQPKDIKCAITKFITNIVQKGKENVDELKRKIADPKSTTVQRQQWEEEIEKHNNTCLVAKNIRFEKPATWVLADYHNGAKLGMLKVNADSSSDYLLMTPHSEVAYDPLYNTIVENVHDKLNLSEIDKSYYSKIVDTMTTCVKDRQPQLLAQVPQPKRKRKSKSTTQSSDNDNNVASSSEAESAVPDAMDVEGEDENTSTKTTESSDVATQKSTSSKHMISIPYESLQYKHLYAINMPNVDQIYNVLFEWANKPKPTVDKIRVSKKSKTLDVTLTDSTTAQSDADTDKVDEPTTGANKSKKTKNSTTKSKKNTGTTNEDSTISSNVTNE